VVKVTSFAGERVAVLGLGRSGLSAARALAAGGAHVHAWDDNEVRRSDAAADQVPLTNLYSCAWDDFGALVLSPGIPLHHPAPHPLVIAARNANCDVIGDIELFAREKPAGKIAAITGTNGKSTTTVLTGHLLEAGGIAVAVGGNVGIPILDLPEVSGDGAYVIELSSYQIDLAPSLAADIAVLLNLSPDHLDRHGNMQGYVAAKRQLLERQHSGQTAIVGMDDAESRAVYASLNSSGRSNTITVSAGGMPDADIFVRDGWLHDRMDESASRPPVANLHEAVDLKGAHNWQNAAAAYAVARCLGCPSTKAAEALLSFPGLEHRMEDLGTVEGIRFINDSKATNVDAATRALSCYDNIIWIAGGREKESDLQSLQPYFPRIAHAFLIGEAAQTFANALEGRVPTTVSGRLETALPEAHTYALSQEHRDSVILLSPACASFDQFSDFEARGNRFKELVRALASLHDEAKGNRRAGGVQ
jgi:UDP-N-acetylmuramoylalanine--D-glutamate ligase